MAQMPKIEIEIDCTRATRALKQLRRNANKIRNREFFKGWLCGIIGMALGFIISYFLFK